MTNSDISDETVFESHLSAEQLEVYRTRGYVIVVAQDGRVYVIHDGESVVAMSDGRQTSHYCVYGCGYTTEPDHGHLLGRHVSMLTQLLFLRSKSKDALMDIGCGDGRFVSGPDGYYSEGRLVGAPPMHGYLAADGVPRGV